MNTIELRHVNSSNSDVFARYAEGVEGYDTTAAQELYENHVAKFDSSHPTIQALIDTDGKSLKKDSSIMSKFVCGLQTPPYEIVRLVPKEGVDPSAPGHEKFEYSVLQNRKSNDDLWKEKGRAEASMSSRHIFLVPNSFDDWRLFNIVALPVNWSSVKLIEDMRTVALKYAASIGMKKPQLYFHPFSSTPGDLSSSINYLHLHIIEAEGGYFDEVTNPTGNLGDSHKIHQGKNTTPEAVIEYIRGKLARAAENAE